jgi:hypothetical protein
VRTAFVVAVALGLALLGPVQGARAADYLISTQTGVQLVPGSTDVGNHCDDCTTQVATPFPLLLYGQAYTTAAVSSNGNIQFGSADPQYTNGCLPTNVFAGAVAAYWDDLTTAGSGNGIYSATIGSLPSRQFVLEWRARTVPGEATVSFEAIFEETSGIIRLRYGVDSSHGGTATVGLQETPTHANQFSCDAASLQNPGFEVTFTPNPPTPPPAPPPPPPGLLLLLLLLLLRPRLRLRRLRRCRCRSASCRVSSVSSSPAPALASARPGARSDASAARAHGESAGCSLRRRGQVEFDRSERGSTWS